MVARGRWGSVTGSPDWLRFPESRDSSDEPQERPAAEEASADEPRADWWGRTAQFWLVVASAVVLAAAAAVFTTIRPATAFETSLVRSVPTAFWTAFYAVLVASVVVYFLSAADNSGYWKHALALVLGDYALYFFLPLARGYLLYGRGSADILVHIGDVENILATGSIWAGSWYPVQHVFVSELVLLGFPLHGAEYVVEFAFTAVFIASFGVLLRTFARTPKGVAYGLAAGTPLFYTVFQTTIIPSFISIMLFPTVMVVLERVRRSESSTYLVVLVVLFTGISLTHPVTAGLLAVLLVASAVIGSVFSWRVGTAVERVPARLALLVAPIVYAWYINLGETQTSIQQVAQAWASGGTAPGAAVVGEASGAALTPLQLVARFVQLYGVIFVFFAVAGLLGLAVLYDFYHRRGRYEEYFAVGQLGVGAVVAVGFLVVYLIESEPTRVARYMIVMAVLCVGLALLRTSEWRPRARRVAQVVLVLCVLTSTVLGANAAYTVNEQLTHSEYDGVVFSLNHHAPNTEITTYSIGHKIEWFTRPDVAGTIWPIHIQTGVPHRLGYDKHTYANQTFRRGYVVTQVYDREFNTDPYFTPAQQQALTAYTSADVETMRNDPSVARVYDNGAFQTWYLAHGKKNETAQPAA